MSKQLSGNIDAKAAHDRLRRALAAAREAEQNAVTIFAEILRRHLYRQLGFASIHIYADQALGFSRTKTYQFIRLAKALDRLPELKAGIRSGKVPWTKARELVKVATPKSEKRWLEIAAGSSRRELEQQVILSKALRDRRKHESGQGELLVPATGRGERLAEHLTGKPAPPEAAPVQNVSLRLSPLRRARFESMVEKLMKRHRRSRDEIVLMALETLLGCRTPVDNDQPLANSVSTGNGEKAAHGSGLPGEAKSTRVDSAAPYQVIVYRCDTCARVTVGSERKPLSEAERGQVECDAKVLEPGKRNRSSIPPARRREVLRRDGHRCRVQGCRSTHFLEVHHLKPRSAGGSNNETNLLVMCANCHGHLHGRGGAMPQLREP